jgi:hypothetical protein
MVMIKDSLKDAADAADVRVSFEINDRFPTYMMH